jgi:hypothetical protein
MTRDRWGGTFEAIVEDVIGLMRDAGALPSDSLSIPWDSFLRLSELVHSSFVVPSTTLTPIMRRLLFATGYATHASQLVGIGTHVGYAFAWLLRDRSDAVCGPFLTRATGFDTNAEATALASKNCSVLGHGSRVQFVNQDGVAGLNLMKHTIDVLYLDLDDPLTGKRGYRAALEAAVAHLKSGSLVIAHDPCVTKFTEDFNYYHDYVRHSGLFAACWVFPVDRCGLSVAVRKRGNH